MIIISVFHKLFRGSYSWTKKRFELGSILAFGVVVGVVASFTYVRRHSTYNYTDFIMSLSKVICVTGRCNLRIIASLTLWQSPSHAKAIALSWWQLHASWPTWQPECDDHHGWHESETNNIWRPPSQCLLFPIYMNGSWCTYISAISYGCWWLVAMLD